VSNFEIRAFRSKDTGRWVFRITYAKDGKEVSWFLHLQAIHEHNTAMPGLVLFVPILCKLADRIEGMILEGND
jgi:hypothetical protein